jgi:hypothetical protein
MKMQVITLDHGSSLATPGMAGEPAKIAGGGPRIEASRTSMICGHDDAQGAALKKGPDFYDRLPPLAELAPDVSGWLVLAQPFIDDLPQQIVFGPGQKFHLGH